MVAKKEAQYKVVNFVSLNEVMKLISDTIAVPQEMKNGFIQILVPDASLSSLQEFQASMFNSLMDKAYRYSEAASILDQHLHNSTILDHQWYDKSLTGKPKLSADAYIEAEQLLMHMSGWFVRYLDAYKAGRLDYFNDRTYPWEGPYKTDKDNARFHEIGFDRAKINAFLSCANILKSIEVILEGESELNSTVHRIDGEIDHVLDRTDQFTKLIDQAIERANSEKIADVFEVLKQMALDATPPFLGFVKDDGLEYSDNDNVRKLFTRNQLKCRLYRLKNKKAQ